MEALRLQNLTRTKVVALGIGSVSLSQLTDIASPPNGSNVIRVQRFSTLNDTEDQLRDASCSGLLTSYNIKGKNGFCLCKLLVFEKPKVYNDM